MAEYHPPKDESGFNTNFASIKPLMSDNEAFYESSRCLNCYDAPCVTACPTSIDIPLFIRQINTKNILGAAGTIYKSNYFGFTCGNVCPTEVLCEGACVYNLSDVKPIEIGRLQSYATDKAIKEDKMFFQPPVQKNKKVAVIGAGPAGISCACELRKAGLEVEIFERKAFPSGLVVYGVAPYKITNQEAVDEVSYLQKQFGFKIYFNTAVNTRDDLKRLESNYDAVFIGFGLGPTSPLKIPGEDFPNVVGAVEWIEELRMNHHKMVVPSKVIVIGGGNTAMDAAGECARMGAESVKLMYRRSKDEMGAYDFEYELAKETGVQGVFNVAPVEITGDKYAKAVKFMRTRVVEGKIEVIPGSDFSEECDMVILAAGQSKQSDLIQAMDGVLTKSDGTVIVNENYQTTNPKYFAAGDAVSGGQEVVNAVAEGIKAAKGILKSF